MASNTEKSRSGKIIGSIFFILISFLLVLSNNLFSQPGKAKLDDYIIKKMQKARIVGLQVGLISGGELAWTGSYGYKNIKTGAKVNDSTLFMIASCSKPVTALAVMKLYENGLLDLDDNINDYLNYDIFNPNHPDKTITFRMLLTHTSSLRDDFEVLMPNYTMKEGGDSPIPLEDYVKDYFLPDGQYYNLEKNFADHAPGMEYWYCNMGYALLGVLIEKITGKSFNEYVRESIFNPLGMNDSYWFLKNIPHDNIARPHILPGKKEDDRDVEVLNHYGYPDYPDGQIRTTVRDYAQILKVMLNRGIIDDQRILKEETVNEMLKIQFPENAKWQAIAWNYNEFDHWLYYLLMPRFPAHTGADPGVATLAVFNPDSGNGVILFSNSPPRTFKESKIFYQEIVKKLLKQAEK